MGKKSRCPTCGSPLWFQMNQIRGGELGSMYVCVRGQTTKRKLHEGRNHSFVFSTTDPRIAGRGDALPHGEIPAGPPGPPWVVTEIPEAERAGKDGGW